MNRALWSGLIAAGFSMALAQTPAPSAFPLPEGCRSPQLINEQGQLIFCRLALTYQVAESKYESGAAIEDKAREAVVIEKGIEVGKKYGIAQEVAQRYWEDQIEASKLLQGLLLEQWKRENRPKVKTDLASVRPQLDQLTEAMMRSLSQSCQERTTMSSLRWSSQASTMPLIAFAVPRAVAGQPVCFIRAMK